jgi:hypothetical protein
MSEICIIHEELLCHIPQDLTSSPPHYHYSENTVETIQRKLLSSHRKNHRHAAMQRMQQAFHSSTSKSIHTILENFVLHRGWCSYSIRITWPVVLIWIVHLQLKVQFQQRGSQRLKGSNMVSMRNPLAKKSRQYHNYFPFDGIEYCTLEYVEQFYLYSLPIITHVFRDSESPMETIHRPWLNSTMV